MSHFNNNYKGKTSPSFFFFCSGSSVDNRHSETVARTKRRHRKKTRKNSLETYRVRLIFGKIPYVPTLRRQQRCLNLERRTRKTVPRWKYKQFDMRITKQTRYLNVSWFCYKGPSRPINVCHVNTVESSLPQHNTPIKYIFSFLTFPKKNRNSK